MLTYDSREVTENTMFICKGAAFKEEYLTSAVEKGAILYISEKEYDTGKEIPHILEVISAKQWRFWRMSSTDLRGKSLP